MLENNAFKKSLKERFKGLPKGKRAAVIITAVLVLIAIVLAIVLPIVLIGPKKVDGITFAAFDQLSDDIVTVRWGKIRGAERYDVEYVYTIQSVDGVYSNLQSTIEKTGTTESETFSIPRKKGTLKVRVRPVFNNSEGEFSEWAVKDILPLILDKPKNLIFDSVGCVFKANPVTYLQGAATRKTIIEYEYEMLINGETHNYGSILTYDPQSTVYQGFVFDNSLRDLIVMIGDYHVPGSWSDVTLTFRLRAFNYGYGIDQYAGDYEYLFDCYEQSEFAEYDFIVTYQIYERLRNI